jgi:hypothetical protein
MPIPFLLIAVNAPVRPANPILAKILLPGSVELYITTAGNGFIGALESQSKDLN